MDRSCGLAALCDLHDDVTFYGDKYVSKFYMKSITKQSATFEKRRGKFCVTFNNLLAFCMGTFVHTTNKQTERLFEQKNSILTYIFKADWSFVLTGLVLLSVLREIENSSLQCFCSRFKKKQVSTVNQQWTRLCFYSRESLHSRSNWKKNAFCVITACSISVSNLPIVYMTSNLSLAWFIGT